MDSIGAAVLVVSPRTAITDLLPDLQKCKPALLELLAAEPEPPVAVPDLTAETAAREILKRRVFHELGGVWRVCWIKRREFDEGVTATVTFPTMATLRNVFNNRAETNESD